jgi:hypothetical protein
VKAKDTQGAGFLSTNGDQDSRNNRSSGHAEAARRWVVGGMTPRTGSGLNATSTAETAGGEQGFPSFHSWTVLERVFRDGLWSIHGSG